MALVLMSVLWVLIFLVRAPPGRGVTTVPVEQWVAHYHYNDPAGAESAEAVAVDPAGNELWVARYNGPGDDWDFASSVAVDAAGNAYITGTSNGVDTGTDVVTIKYDPNGNELWVARYNGPGNADDRGSVVWVDDLGNVYVTGQSEGAGTGADFVTIKYDATGNRLWAARYNGPLDDDDRATALAVDDAGYVYVTGWVGMGGADLDYLTIKYDQDGGELWMRRYAGPYGMDRSRAIALDQEGNVYVTGDSMDVDREDYATVKYDPDGVLLWVARHDAEKDGRSLAQDLAVDQEGKVYVTGFVSLFPPVGNYACHTIKYDTDGTVIGTAIYDTWTQDEYGNALALDEWGNVYVVGMSAWPPLMEVNSSFTIKYSECLDNDEDGYGNPSCGGDDCDDSNPDANPGASEVCDDATGIDEDCDGLINEADPDCICHDDDSDGFGNPSSPACTHPQRDCDDTNPDVYPGAPEIPGNGIDDDCDPSTPSWGIPASVMADTSPNLSPLLTWILAFFLPAGFVLAWKLVTWVRRS